MNTNKILLIASGVIITGIILLLGLILGAIQLTDPELISNEIEKHNKIKVDKNDSLDGYLKKLARYECPDCSPFFKRMDNNGKYSYGCLQFQRETFYWMAEQHSVPLPQGNNSGSEIYSCSIQKEIARKMFEEDPVKAANHWYTSVYVKGLGLPK